MARSSLRHHACSNEPRAGQGNAVLASDTPQRLFGRPRLDALRLPLVFRGSFERPATETALLVFPPPLLVLMAAVGFFGPGMQLPLRWAWLYQPYTLSILRWPP